MIKKQTLKLKGMHCTSCAKLIEAALAEERITAKVDFASNKVDIKYDERKISIEQIIKIIKEEGYEAYL